ncbi:MAG: hypothetical protein HY258_01990 [Chloroflexi bacterium]|nr:hypothetical protein [Chloroflexota bacterium]
MGVKVSVGGNPEGVLREGVNEGRMTVAVGVSAIVIVVVGVEVAAGTQDATALENVRQIKSRIILDFISVTVEL